MGILDNKNMIHRILLRSMSQVFAVGDLMGKVCRRVPFLFITVLAAQAHSQPTEYEVKAACLYNFAKFIDWPEESFADSTSPIIIGVLGEDPFEEDLENIIENKFVKNRPFQIKRWNKWNSRIKSCHILFISYSEEKHFKLILEFLKDSSVLTVSEVPGFTYLGGIVNFYLESQKIRFKINRKAAEKARLKISSQLLRVAKNDTN